MEILDVPQLFTPKFAQRTVINRGNHVTTAGCLAGPQAKETDTSPSKAILNIHLRSYLVASLS
jgi:hypothetical protein